MNLKNFKISLIVYSFLLSSLSLAAQDKVIWGDQPSESIHTSDLDGSNNTIIHSGQQVVRRMEYNPADENLYWVSGGSGSINKSKLDGSGLETVYTANSSNINCVEIDNANNKLYFTISNTGSIQTVNMDGTGEQTIITGLGNVQGLAYDAQADLLFWSETNNGVIKKSDGNGNNIETILQVSTQPFDLELDTFNQTIYYSDRELFHILKTDYNGSSPATIISTAGNKGVVTLDLVNDKIYWVNTDLQYISRANLDGSDVNIIFSGTSQLSGLEVVPTPPVIISTDKLENKLTDISLFPNPSIDIIKINLELKSNGKVNIEIFDVSGKQVFQEKLIKSSSLLHHRIDFSQNPSGLYFLKVTIGDQVFTKRFMHNYHIPRA